MNTPSYPFMQRTLFAALLNGLVAPTIGAYIVQRRLPLLDDRLGYVVIMGVGLALLMGTAPLPIAVATCVAGSVAVELLRQSDKTSSDLGLAVLFYGGATSGVMITGIAGRGPAGLSVHLSGTLTSMSESGLRVIVALAVVVLVFSLGLLPQLFVVCADEDFARAPSIRVKLLNLLAVVIAPMAVTLSMHTVGLLLTSALVAVPAATPQQLFIDSHTTLLGAMRIGIFAALGGMFGSYHWNTAMGTTIVAMAIALLRIATLVGIFLAPSPRFIPFTSPHRGKERILAEKPTETGSPFG